MSYLSLLALLGLFYFLPELVALARGELPLGKEASTTLAYRMAWPLGQRLRFHPSPASDARARELRDLLDQAGMRGMSTDAFRARQQASAMLWAAAVSFVYLVSGMDVGFAAILVGMAAVLGHRLPLISLRRRAEARKREIYVSLPFFAAQLANRIMGSGRRLSDAMRVVAEEGDGPLHQEVAHAFRLIDLQGYPFAQALLHVGRATGVQAVVDLFTLLVYAENRAGMGLVETLLRASKEASENLRYSLEAAKGRAVIRGTGMAIAFEIPPILMSVLLPVGISLGVNLLGIPWF
ncbi:MAG: type II secretion system F family protein [Chloroflexi bacterium]|nr:type II secretion system F family protein [Chloroflexota bacterium]